MALARILPTLDLRVKGSAAETFVPVKSFAAAIVVHSVMLSDLNILGVRVRDSLQVKHNSQLCLTL